MGIKKLKRLGGRDRAETSNLIALENKVKVNTPVVVASGDNFPDALSISSFAAYNGWPILLVSGQELNQQALDFLKKDLPSKVYIAGGTGAVSESVETQLLVLLPKAKLIRFAGADRFETAGKILEEFAPQSDILYVATGNDFADALAGSVLAAQNNAPIVLVDSFREGLPEPIANYLKKLKRPKPYIFGGTGPVSGALEAEIASILSETDPGIDFEVIGID